MLQTHHHGYDYPSTNLRTPVANIPIANYGGGYSTTSYGAQGGADGGGFVPGGYGSQGGSQDSPGGGSRV